MKFKSIYNKRLTTHFHRLVSLAILRQSHWLVEPITISRIDLTPDLRIAKIFFTSDHFELHTQITNQLNLRIPQIKNMISRKWKYRHLPDIIFRYDRNLIAAEHVSLILDVEDQKK